MGLFLSHLGALNRIPIQRQYQLILSAALVAGHTLPTDRVQARQNRLYRDLSSAGIIGLETISGGKLDCLWNFTHDGTVGFGYQNIANPGSNVCTVGAAGLVHTDNDGLKGNGSGYLIANYSCFSGNTHFGAPGFSVTSVVKESTGINGILVGRTDSGSTSHVWLRGRQAADTAEGRICQVTNFLVPTGMTDGSGVIYLEKSGNTISYYRNNSLLATRADADIVARPANSLYLFARSAGSGATADTFTTATQRMIAIGGQLSAYQRQYLVDAWDLYFNSL
jgi:hypothetical protein